MGFERQIEIGSLESPPSRQQTVPSSRAAAGVSSEFLPIQIGRQPVQKANQISGAREPPGFRGNGLPGHLAQPIPISKSHTMIMFRHTLIAILFFVAMPSTVVAQESATPEARQICSLKADGSDLQVIAKVAKSLVLTSPAVSPVANQILFSSWDDEDGETRQNSRIARLNSLIRTASPLNFSLGDGAMPSWSPRGKRLAITRFALSRGVWVMKSDGTQKKLLDRLGANAKWSPNGHMIAYTKTVRGARTIAVYDMVEDRSFELWENSGSPYEKISESFAWSPDSLRICLRGRRPIDDAELQDEDLSEIATVLIHDSSKLTLHELCEDGQHSTMTWHPDGKRIVFSKLTDDGKLTQLYWFDPGSTTDDQSKPFPGQDGTRNNSSACWTHDGSRLIFISTAQLPEETP
jgi:Tol biopolymer transport system component